MTNIVEDLLSQKQNISEQLRLLRKYRNHPEVQEYIASLEASQLTNYVRYLIKRYYYNDKTVVRPKKICIDTFYKLILRPCHENPKKEE